MAEFIDVIPQYYKKAATLIFSIIFLWSLSVFRENLHSVMIFFYVLFGIFNIINLFAGKYLEALIESIIYEIMGILGVLLISWYYVLLFILAADVIHYFKNKKLLWCTIVGNSLFYCVVYAYFILNYEQRGFYPLQAFLLLFVSIIIILYFIKAEEDYKEMVDREKIIEEKEDFEQKYLELLKEHKDIILLKEIMELSNKPVDINEMISEMNEELIQNFDNIDFTTILLYDEKRKNFSIVVSSVPNHFHKTLSNIDQFEEFEDVIDKNSCEVLNSDVGLTYPTAIDRGIMSALCVPLHTSKELIGIILLESQTAYAFMDLDINQFNLVRYNISLIVENKRWVEKIEKMALQDGLTGVYNRNYLFDFLAKQKKWHSENQKAMCLVLFDIDHFKKFNDTYGHLFGDLVLKEVSNLVKESIRETDLIARYGGEEFIIVFVDSNKELAKERTDQIRIGIQNMVVKNEDGVEANVTVSFGIAEFGENSYNINDKELIERADQALYRSKDEGRNRVTVYEG